METEVDGYEYVLVDLAVHQGKEYLNTKKPSFVFREMLVYQIILDDLKRHPYERTSKIKDPDVLKQSYLIRSNFLREIIRPGFEIWYRKSKRELKIEFFNHELSQCEKAIQELEIEIDKGCTRISEIESIPDQDESSERTLLNLTMRHASNQLVLNNTKTTKKKIEEELKKLGVEK